MTEGRIYSFEGIGDALELLPLAARRALDASGIKVSLEAWQQAPLELRRAMVRLGSVDVVVPPEVEAALAEAGVASSVVRAIAEPPSDVVPAELAHAVTLVAWGSLRPLDRYSLAKVARGKHPEAVLPRALAEIAPLSTHVTADGDVRMVDVGPKAVTARRAIAHAHVAMEPATAARLKGGDVAKGDVLATARIAGIQAAKRTSELIPLCHAIALTRVAVDLVVEADGVAITVTADAVDRTGVEMEALTGASVAALTIYDMLKSTDRAMRITVELAEKRGGKTGTWSRGATG